MALVSSTLTLTLIACDRFFGVVFAMKARLTVRRANVLITCIWICSIVVSSPLLVFRQQVTREWLDHREIWCADNWPVVVKRDLIKHTLSMTHPWCETYFTSVSVMLYFIPVVVMVAAYSVIVCKMRYNRMPGEQIGIDMRTNDVVKQKKVRTLQLLPDSYASNCWTNLPANKQIKTNEIMLKTTTSTTMIFCQTTYKLWATYAIQCPSM